MNLKNKLEVAAGLRRTKASAPETAASQIVRKLVDHITTARSKKKPHTMLAGIKWQELVRLLMRHLKGS